MWRLASLFVCVFLISVHGQTQVTQCVNYPGALPINTYIEGCVQPPCLLEQLKDVVLNIVFEAPRTMRKMTTLVTAYLQVIGLPIPVDYPLLENSITCNFLSNTYCPVIKGEVVQYTLKMFMEPFFVVGTQASLEFRVVDEDLEPVLCLRSSIRIVASSGSLSDRTNTNATIVRGQ